MAEETKQTTTPETEQTSSQEKAQSKTKKPRQNKALQQAEEKLATLQEQMLRTLAEYDNYRKRTQKEKEAMYADGIVYAVKNFLPIIDNLERAIAAVDEDNAMKDGVSMILQQTNEMLKNMGVTQFGEAGEEFDPQRHAAVMHIEDENLPENSIVEVLQKGYVYKEEHIVRHAAVKVAN